MEKIIVKKIMSVFKFVKLVIAFLYLQFSEKNYHKH